ncbi:hypothetical protein B0T14DRAFT_518278 [Immersiella caudata]|uniref:Uncharacterized protein n=1 Tax=Immersiella caudata TaxID=314043 RepID=A0AA39WP01_9PEZI|nr:hypothetical protein B0T14DRAFT_518278 [Immersiella caudata]
MAAPKSLTSDDLHKILNEKDHLAVVHCFTSTADEKAIRATMALWARRYPEAAYYTLDVAESQDIVKELEIEDSVSRFLILRDGKKIGSVHCATAADEKQLELAEEEIQLLLGRRCEE